MKFNQNKLPFCKVFGKMYLCGSHGGLAAIMKVLEDIDLCMFTQQIRSATW